MITVTFCNGCFWIEPDEEYQTPRKEPHVCLYHDKIVKHTDEDRNLHPMIVAVSGCTKYETPKQVQKRFK